jgi:GxxExxY protein
MRSDAELKALTERILGAAFEVHTQLGPGLLESTYGACLAYELAKRGLRFEVQVALPVIYDGKQLLDVGYRIDVLVENEIVLELKAIDAIAPVHKAQLLSYLRHSKKRVGLLINFNVERLKDGITRRINGYEGKKDEHRERGGTTEEYGED